jgi:Gpi18-like mannosyltransferase
MQFWIKTKALPALLIAGGIILALYVRSIFFPALNLDSKTFLIPWYDFIQSHGFLGAFSQKFYDYNPPYLYLIGLVTYLPWIPKLTAIKLISVVFDFAAAAAGFKIAVTLKKSIKWGWIAFFTILFTPTLIVESGLWGQCDIIYTAFLLWMAYALLNDKPRQALLFFSIAFVFKSQAIFQSFYCYFSNGNCAFLTSGFLW